PYVRAWFDTPFSIPYHHLLQEYKDASSPQVQWNLSIIWVSETENNSPATIGIVWNTTPVIKNFFDSFQLYENNTVVADMLNENSYSFESNGTIHHLKIIGQTTSSDGNTTQHDLSIYLIGIGVGGLIIVIVLALFWYKRKK
ncbi:MAG: hypothetical protein JXA75_00100, partial [Candidatus Thermoplasmatota archaeon]|nr:hypothetical protein [Candidatus Thermoplasmatota archaeon]